MNNSFDPHPMIVHVFVLAGCMGLAFCMGVLWSSARQATHALDSARVIQEAAAEKLASATDILLRIDAQRAQQNQPKKQSTVEPDAGQVSSL